MQACNHQVKRTTKELGRTSASDSHEASGSTRSPIRRRSTTLSPVAIPASRNTAASDAPAAASVGAAPGASADLQNEKESA